MKLRKSVTLTCLLEHVLQHLSPNYRTEYRYSLPFFSGCLFSSGLVHGMIGVDQTKDQGLEDDLVSIFSVYN